MAREPVDYWEKRSTELMKRLEKETENTINALIQAYEQATKDINKEIGKIFNKYATDGKLTKGEALELLNTKETKEFYNELLEEINTINDDEIKRKLLAKYNAPAYAYRINRYEALQQNIDIELKKLANIEQQITEIRYVDTIEEGYYHTIYDIQKGTGLGFSFAQIDMRTINLLLNENWIDNANFSQRIWNNSEKLGNYLRTQLTADTMSGKSVQKIAQELAEYMNVGLYNATRLVRTEVNHFANESEMLSYKECGIEKYRFIATLDNRTCGRCASLDNKVFNVKDRRAGSNCPPIHANDRCTTVAEFDDEVTEGLERRARDENGMPILVPQDMSYKDWYSKYVTNKKKYDTIDTQLSTDKITLENLPNKLGINLSTYDPYDNDIQEQVAELLNMADFPKIISKVEYQKYEGQEIVRILHDYHGKTAEEAYNNTLYGKIQYSENTNSSFGRGIYFGDKNVENTIKDLYSKRDNDKILNAKISNNAKIIEFKTQLEYLQDVDKRLLKVPENLRSIYEKEKSLLYMLDGIDGIKLKHNDYYCIYNRGVLIVSE